MYQACHQEIFEKDHHILDILKFRGPLSNLTSWSLLSEEGTVSMNTLSRDYQSFASLKRSGDESRTLTLQISLNRKNSKGIVEIIAPPGLLVIVSWVRWLQSTIFESKKKEFFFDISDKFPHAGGINTR